MNTQQQVALVTGAGSGIGRAIAEAFANEGYVVYGTSRRANFETVQAGGASYCLLPMTLEDEQSVADAVRYVIDRHGRVDVLVNAAGSGIAGAIEDTTADEARAQFEVCFFGVLRVLNHVLPLMRAAGGGTVINIGSMAAFTPLPFQGMYSSVKAAMFMLTGALRMETEPFGIRVCQVDPGDTRTGFTEKRVLTKASGNTAYRQAFTRALYEMIRSEQMAKGPEACAKVALKMARMKKPPVRRLVRPGDKTLFVLIKFLPWNLMKRVVCAMYLRKDPPEEGVLTNMLKKSIPWKE
jgi:NAD(P)-dependent dehydrogenase (short-subunit alcohol dehydrogenase family)